MTRQVADSQHFGRTYFTLAYTLAHSIDNVSGFQQRNSNVPTADPGLFRASSDQDIRNRITFSGGWDLPIEKMWDSGPKRLTQGWSLFPIVTWRSGFPFDVFARLGDRFNQFAEGPSGLGDVGNIHANIVPGASLATLNPRESFANVGGALVPCTTALAATVGCSGNYWIDPNSLTSAQSASTCTFPFTDPTCAPSATQFPSNAQAVANAAYRTYGTLPRNFLRGPGYVNFDMAFSKTTALIGERMKLEFRGEFFNLFNHANFKTPTVANNGANINSSVFGQLTATEDPRIIQLAVRLSF